ncbi:hypothetical protein [Clostridium sp. CF012]|uniref:hypothetical protein n=1 Tax=Clostridium sp. CF012 TaxID=2843319 RepID=UPI001C0D1A2F|nr:hypothetical protein [Clostridium sp. CF012]MBU3146207.1 hypothetical protein [Clostridium sp. CF012]
MMNEFNAMDNVLQNLSLRFMPLQKYDEALNIGNKMLLKEHTNIPRLHSLYPNSPLTFNNRYIRMSTADTILKIAHVTSSKITQEVLDTLHNHIFDNCTAFRLALVQSLLCVGNSSSIQPVQQLYNIEKESTAVRNTCEIVLYKILNNKFFLDWGNFIYVGDINEEAADGEGKMYYKHNGQVIYEGGFRNNHFHGLGIYYDYNKNVQNKGSFVNGEFVR